MPIYTIYIYYSVRDISYYAIAKMVTLSARV